ncbi:flagellar basal body P-ring protein FlgI [Niveibacterium umoris]|uniref:Flagellar P-ring protein n=1 Tax=Niveibacterium umoris TaxID=1193620 RepID=A0A840BJR1_9RHOO|nr:flagellar basal body P-ring protein FlgI [Niveibacterium umoris]MBB4011136.1 flagellar P-ring protein precursor FlgI [Niveibacterium umoris]
MCKRIKVLLAALSLCLCNVAGAERIKDIANIAGVRSNPLVGYGLVVGLDGTGDQTTQTPFTVQSIANMLSNMGVALPAGVSLQLKNVAAVMVTATLPPFAQPGQEIDVTASSLGNAKSLKGGTLLMTPLKGPDGNVYALAQGNLVISGASGGGGGSKVTVNHVSAGRIPGGAIVERAVPMPVGAADSVSVELRQADFGTAQKVAEAINRSVGKPVAMPLNGRQIQVSAPAEPDRRVAFLGMLENLDVVPEQGVARVIVNSRTGSVVMNRAVQLQDCAVAHGSLTVTVTADNQVSQPNAFARGETTTTQNTQVDIKQEPGNLIKVKAGTNLAEVVKAINAVGANPLDMIAILQAMKAAGALRAELEVI